MEIPKDNKLIAEIRSKNYDAYRRTGMSDDFINGHIQGFADCYNWLVKLECKGQKASTSDSALPMADVGGNEVALPTDEQIDVQAYQRDYFRKTEEIAFKDGAKWLRSKVSEQ